jgi:hypothetical protein
MRCGFGIGTLSYDMVRAGHFSGISKSPVTGLFPSQTPSQGWNKYRDVIHMPISTSSILFMLLYACLYDIIVWLCIISVPNRCRMLDSKPT